MRRLTLLFLLLIFIMPTIHAQTTPTVVSYTLPNGLELLVQEDHRAPVVTSQVWYKIGSSYEPSGITGISHALEHMMFKGTPAHKMGEYSRIVAENGGQENAMTSTDYTLYYQVIDASKLPVAFELESDRMRNLTLDPAEFAKEIQVVMEERRMRFEDNPQSLTYERFIAAAYVANTYHHLPIGWMSDLQQMTVKDLRAWYNQWYAPNNAIVVVVGDVNPEQVHQLALKYFGPLQPSVLPAPKNYIEIPSLGPREVIVKLPAQLPWIAVGYNVPSIKSAPHTDDPYALAVITSILSDGDSSWLSRDLVRAQRIVASASANYEPFAKLSTLMMLEATPAQGHTLAQARAALFSEIKQLQDQLVTEKELGRVKAGIIANKVYFQDSIADQATQIGSLVAVGLPWQLRDDFIKKISAVTPEQVQSAARRYLTPDNATVAELHPLPMTKEQAAKALSIPSPVGEKNVH
jgi:zinc protease